MNVARPVLDRVVNHLMGVVRFQPVVREQGIGVQRRTGFDMLTDLFLDRFPLAVRDYYSANFAATLNDAHYSGLVFPASPGNAALALGDVHVPRFAADESFVGLNMSAGPFERTIVQRHADAVIEKPCGFLSDAQIPRNLARANAVLAVHNQPESGQPFINSSDER